MITFTCPKTGLSYSGETHFNWRTGKPQCPDCLSQGHTMDHEKEGDVSEESQKLIYRRAV